MYKQVQTIIVFASLILVTGCSSLTSAGVAKEMMPEYRKSYELSVKAKAAIAERVMMALIKLNRGGMKLNLDKNGKIASISYIEHMDLSVIKKALDVPEMQIPKVKSGIEETGELLKAVTGIVVPVGAMYYGYKVAKSNNAVDEHRIDADVKIIKSNNDLSKSMYSNFTNTKYPPEYMIPQISEEETETEE